MNAVGKTMIVAKIKQNKTPKKFMETIFSPCNLICIIPVHYNATEM